MTGAMFFDGWAGIVRTVIVGILAYAILVGMLRASGKRTLSKMNAFDLVVTVALGSTLATIILSKDVGLVEGIVAPALLIGLQLAITWLSVRSSTISHLVKAEPTLLLHRGELLHAAMRRERVTEAEVLAAVRSQGIASLDEVEAVVLETDASFTTIKATDHRSGSALASVSGHERH
ncbi:MAG: DUF421 domain-containing protein [Chloroflexota bacterium]|nr:DUF421 domain-containing protein [Chloroflexota bacterium]